MHPIVVVGGGAAGMMAALAAAQNGAPVVLLEGNEKLGKKIYITGKGRCNVTNAARPDAFLRSVMRNPKFLNSALRRYPPDALCAFLEASGVPVKTERGDRVFPASDKASDVTRAFDLALSKAGVKVRLGAHVKGLEVRDGRVLGVWTEAGLVEASGVILATGGLSYPSTGSRGEGHGMLMAAGHEIKACLPALCGVETEEDWPKSLQGLSLVNVGLKALGGKKAYYDEQGEMLFTHFGISGPLVLSLSSCLPEQPAGVQLLIDMKPALDLDTLDKRLVRELAAHASKRLPAVLDTLLPRAMTPLVARLAGLDEKMAVNQLTKGERRRLAELLKAVPLRVKSLRPMAEAIVTRGGADVRGFDPSTMASKTIGGLYACGELLDVDALTGGYNLHIAFCTGHAAGVAAAEAVLSQNGGDAHADCH